MAVVRSLEHHDLAGGRESPSSAFVATVFARRFLLRLESCCGPTGIDSTRPWTISTLTPLRHLIWGHPQSRQRFYNLGYPRGGAPPQPREQGRRFATNETPVALIFATGWLPLAPLASLGSRHKDICIETHQRSGSNGTAF